MRRVAVALLAVFLALPALAQSWYDNYNHGVAAVRARNWATGAALLEKAIAEIPAENAKLRASREFITYTPHFWLGIAKVGLNEPDAALAEFRISEEQGVVQNTPFYAQMREWIGQAQDLKKRNAESAAAGSKRDANAAIGRALSAQTEAVSAGADRSDAYRSAQRKLQEALEAFNRAGTDVRAYNRASEAASQARDLFAGAAEEARKAKAARPVPQPKPVQPPQPQPQPREVVVPFDETPKPVPQPSKPAPQPVVVQPQPQPVVVPQPQPPVISRALADARAAVQAYRRRLIQAKQPVADAVRLDRALAGNPDEATIARILAEVAQREQALDAMLAPKPVPVPVPVPTLTPPPAIPDTHAELEAAYRAYAAGDLAGSESMLTGAIAKAATAEAYVLRGCTRYTRAMLSRTPDALLAAAADDFRRALQMNAALRLDEGAFSPKLVAFFEKVRSGK